MTAGEARSTYRPILLLAPVVSSLVPLATLFLASTDPVNSGISSGLLAFQGTIPVLGAVLVLAAIAVGLTVVKGDRPPAEGSERFDAEPAMAVDG